MKRLKKSFFYIFIYMWQYFCGFFWKRHKEKQGQKVLSVVNRWVSSSRECNVGKAFLFYKGKLFSCYSVFILCWSLKKLIARAEKYKILNICYIIVKLKSSYHIVAMAPAYNNNANSNAKLAVSARNNRQPSATMSTFSNGKWD